MSNQERLLKKEKALRALIAAGTLLLWPGEDGNLPLEKRANEGLKPKEGLVLSISGPEEVDKTQEVVILHPLETLIASQIQAYRTNNGLSPLELEPQLVLLARTRAEQVVQRTSQTGSFYHNSEDLDGFVNEQGQYLDWRWGELLARTNLPQEEIQGEIVGGFILSPGHKEIIESANYTHLGVGFGQKDGFSYFVVLMLGPQSKS